MTPPRIAYSYIRFSSKRQARGDSYRRQTEATTAYCARKGWALSPHNYEDLGVSAWKGKNATHGALAAFLRACEEGKVPAGSVLVVESLDRLSREGRRKALALFLALLEHKVTIATLTPEREYTPEGTDEFDLIEAILILSRAAEESQRKSERVRAANVTKRAAARTGARVVLAPALPAWCKLDGGRIVLDPVRAAAARRVFELARDGYGATQICKRLEADHVPPIGTKAHWVKGYVSSLLRDRRVLGEFQPPDDGPVLPAYFPALLTEQEWYAARAGVQDRSRKPGRPPVGRPNLFRGILRDARDGSNMMIQGRVERRRGGAVRSRSLVSARADRGAATFRSFPYDVFEEATLRCLREVDPADVLGQGPRGGEAEALEGELGEVRARLAEVAEALKDARAATLAAVVRVLDELGDRERKLAARLEQARAEAARPLEGAWDEARTLLEALAAAPDQDDARVRLTAALARVVSHIWLLVVPRGRVRLAAVQVHFTDGGYRDYLLIHRQAGGGVPAATHVASARDWDDDLREGWEETEASLLAYPKDVVERLLAP